MRNLLLIPTYLSMCLVLPFCRHCTGVVNKSYTPSNFLNEQYVDSKAYTNDSLMLIRYFNDLLKRKEESFYSEAYFDSTILSIDTILYSPPSLRKIAVLVIVKNATSRPVVPKNEYKWYYDAYCYIGIKNDSGEIDLRWLTNYSTINWYNKKEISDEIRNMHFAQFAILKDTSGLPLYGYNLDDKRFWTSKVWPKYFPED